MCCCVWNPSLPACGLKRPVGSSPNETITVLFWASVIVAVSDSLETKLPATAAWVFDFIVNSN